MRGRRPEGAVNTGSLLETLVAAGHHPAAIDVLALTHLHTDHVGWVTAFRGARQVLAAAEWKAYPPGGGTLPVPINPAVLEALDPVLVEDGDEVLPGVRAIVTPGHSPGHTSYLISSGPDRLLAFGDAFHHPVQLAHVEWGSGPDWNGDTVPAARRRLIDEMLVPGTIGFAFHFGDQPFGRVTRAADGTVGWEPVPTTVVSGPPRLLA